MSLKKKIAKYFDDEKGNAKGEDLLDYFISVLILINVLAIILESYKEIYTTYKTFFTLLELFTIIVFSIEYVVRVWVSDLIYPTLSPTRARLKYVFSFMGLVDLASILPFYLPFIVTLDLRIVRLLRLFRLLRVLKLNRNFKSLAVIRSVIVKTKNEILVSAILVFILLIIASTLMFYIENKAQPEAFENIGQSLWWAVATLTTVGYGDIYPITGLGKIMSAVIALLGIGFVALPTGIISSAYIEEIRSQKQSEKCVCPHCHKEINN
ncbi:ion transporter [Psychroserpens sp. NJDZ02]|uniref:ion transporter n=1 Tax=Psychroserpens sp. NJDZ02 TaxID=2570561 RepID=UPI0010A91A38|nr:ion transporter [Psychroserpens sp. NJDZ02]QCE42660.1 ion transporter [Psychroserpens sp. NJDZ02]